MVIELSSHCGLMEMAHMNHRRFTKFSLRFLVEYVLFGSLCFVLAGCAGILGGATRIKVSQDQTPHEAIAALRKTHPDATIDEIEGVFSQGPPLYRLRYHDGHAKGGEAE